VLFARRVLLQAERNACTGNESSEPDSERLRLEDGVLNVVSERKPEILQRAENRDNANWAKSLVVGLSQDVK